MLGNGTESGVSTSVWPWICAGPVRDRMTYVWKDIIFLEIFPEISLSATGRPFRKDVIVLPERYVNPKRRHLAHGASEELKQLHWELFWQVMCGGSRALWSQDLTYTSPDKVWYRLKYCPC